MVFVSVRLMVRLYDPKGRFQPRQYYDSKRHILSKDWRERNRKVCDTTVEERGMDGIDWTKGTWFINGLCWVLGSIRAALCYFSRTKMPSDFGCTTQVQWDLPAEWTHGSSFSHWLCLGAVSRTFLDQLLPLPGVALNSELTQQGREEAGPPAALGHSLPSKTTCGRGWVKTLIAVLWSAWSRQWWKIWGAMLLLQGHLLLWQCGLCMDPKAPGRRRQGFLALFIYCVLGGK